MVRDVFFKHPKQLALVKQNNPSLADALMPGNLKTFSTVLRQQIQTRYERAQQRKREADSFDQEAPRLIAKKLEQTSSSSSGGETSSIHLEARNEYKRSIL